MHDKLIYPFFSTTLANGLICFLFLCVYRISKEKRSNVMLDHAAEGEKYAKHGFREYLSTKHPGVPGIFPSPINSKHDQ